MYDVAIVGAGGAGLSAAIFSARLDLKTIVVTMDLGGRALVNSPYAARSIENYPGFESITGVELMRKFEIQSKRFGAEFMFAEVINLLATSEESFKLETTSHQVEAKTMILAFGETPMRLGITGEEKFEGRGLSYCAHCDATSSVEKTVAVVGFGERAVDSALLLSKIAKKVYLIYWWDTSDVASSLKFIEDKPCIEIVGDSSVVGINGREKVESIVIQRPFGIDRRELKVDCLFVELGSKAKTDFLKGFVDLDRNGKVTVDRDCCTSRPGVFAAGDITDTLYKQIVISAGDGARAALSAFNYLQAKENGVKLYSDILTIRKKS
jgi:thioredoxin reductase (NADPH)